MRLKDKKKGYDMTESMLNPIKITDGSKEHLKALESSIQKATSKEQLSAISVQDKELLKKNYKVTRLTKEESIALWAQQN